ncbi:YcaO-like family protein [Microbacterium sp. X-17]|uniref:YcaO-like family protein n=1 Tax=Microbacterium sp. X-17 TaxID=3144404 RepID=UPI0031F4C9DF
MNAPFEPSEWSLEPSLASLADVISPEAGLIGSVTQISTHEDPFHVYVAGLGELEAVQDNIRRISELPSGVEMAGSGGNINPLLARAIATVEAIERYSNCVPAPGITWATQDELVGRVVDMSEMPACSPIELAHPKCVVAPFDPEERVRWTRGWSLLSNEPVWVPAVNVWMHIPALTSSERFTLPISTGSAAHTSLANAILNAICEVVERDSIALTWMQMLALPRIEFANASETLRRALESAESTGIEYAFFDATTDLGLPTVYCVDTDHASSKLRHVVMCATDPDPERAVIKILREIAASRMGLNSVRRAPESVDDFHDVFHGAQYMGAAERAHAFDFLLNTTAPSRGIEHVASMVGGDSTQELEAVLEAFRLRGWEVVVVDISTVEARDAGVTVVKVIIPRLMPLSFVYRSQFRAHPRLFDAPRNMGLVVRSEEELNRFPQPFA